MLLSLNIAHENITAGIALIDCVIVTISTCWRGSNVHCIIRNPSVNFHIGESLDGTTHLHLISVHSHKLIYIPVSLYIEDIFLQS